MSSPLRSTEEPSHYSNLERMSIAEIVEHMNREDQIVAMSVQRALPQITALSERVLERMKNGGRLFYLGAGTSGRLGILDASECPPTFGVPHGLVVGLIAGGDAAIRKAVEFAEDNLSQGMLDLEEHGIGDMDSVVGIAASGRTPYVVGALESCRKKGILTGSITCTTDSAVAAASDIAVEVPVGPEFVTGSTRLKCGTAQKMVLNMLSTSVMIGLGRVKGNRMVDMQLSNNKLVDRGTRMVMDELHVGYDEAQRLLLAHGSVRAAIDSHGLPGQP